MKTTIFIIVIIICAVFLLHAQLQIDNAKELNTLIPTQLVISYTAQSKVAPRDVYNFVKIIDPVGRPVDFKVDRVDENGNFDLPGMIYITLPNTKQTKIPYKLQLINIDGQFNNSVIKVRSNDPKSMIDEITYKPLQSGFSMHELPLTGATKRF